MRGRSKRSFSRRGSWRSSVLSRRRQRGVIRRRRAPKRRSRRVPLRRPSLVALGQRAFEAGRDAAQQGGFTDRETTIRRMNESWNDWSEANRIIPLGWEAYHELAGKYAGGFAGSADDPIAHTVLAPTRKSIGIVLTAMNEEDALPDVLEQVARLPLAETVVVVNGSADQTFRKARQASGGIVVHYPEPLGHDVGRAAGAKLTRADIVLFLDGDFPIRAEQLVPFIYAVDRGVDMALNDLRPYIGNFSARDPVTIMKEMLNRSLGRGDLGPNSLTAVPHALSRRALSTIGCVNLIVPPKAQALAIRSGLRVETAVSVDVITKNRVREKNSGDDNPVSRLIVGDHLEAFGQLMRSEGPRLRAQDTIRIRAALGGASS